MRLRIRGRRSAALAALLALAVAAPLTANAAPGGADRAPRAAATAADEDTRQYEIPLRDDRAARTALARTGVAIDEVDARAVVVSADAAEAAALREAGYELKPLAGPPK
ncbi:zinc carboxypeptidase, partial [Streptomyces sp. NPDC093510]